MGDKEKATAFFDEITEGAPEPAKKQLALMFALGAALGGDEFITGFKRVVDGLCPDCGVDIKTHPDELRCFQKVEGQQVNETGITEGE